MSLQDIEHWRRIETWPVSFYGLYIWKIVYGLCFYDESIVRTLERLLLMFTVPGLTDHWPSDYERCLRTYALLESERLHAACARSVSTETW